MERRRRQYRQQLLGEEGQHQGRRDRQVGERRQVGADGPAAALLQLEHDLIDTRAENVLQRRHEEEHQVAEPLPDAVNPDAPR